MPLTPAFSQPDPEQRSLGPPDVWRSDLCSGLVGGLGLVPGANIGSRFAVFEAVHGSAPDLAGKGLANPIAVVRSAALLLQYIGQARAATQIEEAVRRTLRAGRGLTRDLGGEGTTATVTEQITTHLKEG